MQQVKWQYKRQLMGKIIGIFALLWVASAVDAANVSGSMGFYGGYSLGNGTDLGNTTSLNLLDVYGVDGSTGDLGNVNFFSTGSSANPFDFPSIAITNLATIEGWRLDITTSSVDIQNMGFLDMLGSGVITCVTTSSCDPGGVGFTPTAVNWTLSANSDGTAYSMSVTAVPVPAALWLFGSGLLCIIGIARRNKPA